MKSVTKATNSKEVHAAFWRFATQCKGDKIWQEPIGSGWRKYESKIKTFKIIRNTQLQMKIKTKGKIRQKIKRVRSDESGKIKGKAKSNTKIKKYCE